MKDKIEHYVTVFISFCADLLGSPRMFIIGIVFVVSWILSGLFLHFSNTWQAIINTITAIITFLTVFIIQNTQNRNDRAIQLKLDELIHSMENARNEFIELEELDDKDLKKLREEYKNKKATGEIIKKKK